MGRKKKKKRVLTTEAAIPISSPLYSLSETGSPISSDSVYSGECSWYINEKKKLSAPPKQKAPSFDNAYSQTPDGNVFHPH